MESGNRTESSYHIIQMKQDTGWAQALVVDMGRSSRCWIYFKGRVGKVCMSGMNEREESWEIPKFLAHLEAGFWDGKDSRESRSQGGGQLKNQGFCLIP